MVIKKSITLGLFLNLGNCMVILSVHVPCPLCTGVLMILSYIFLLCPLCTGVLVIFSYYFYYFVHFIQVFWWYLHIFFYFVHYVQVFWWYFHIFFTLSTLYRCFGATFIYLLCPLMWPGILLWSRVLGNRWCIWLDEIM